MKSNGECIPYPTPQRQPIHPNKGYLAIRVGPVDMDTRAAYVVHSVARQYDSAAGNAKRQLGSMFYPPSETSDLRV